MGAVIPRLSPQEQRHRIRVVQRATGMATRTLSKKMGRTSNVMGKLVVGTKKRPEWDDLADLAESAAGSGMLYETDARDVFDYVTGFSDNLPLRPPTPEYVS